MTALAPGVGVTLYDGNDLAANFQRSRSLLVELAPSLVTLHGPRSQMVPSLVDAIRAAIPGVRIGAAIGANPLAIPGPAGIERAAAEGRKWGERARELGLAWVEPNIECGAIPKGKPGEPRKPRGPGWVRYAEEMPGDSPRAKRDEAKRQLAALDPTLVALFDAIGAECNAELFVTSHDYPQTHPLPPSAYKHPAVKLLRPQVYPATSIDPAEFIGAAGALRRYRTSAAQFAATRALGGIRPDLKTGTYFQLWGLTPGATATLADTTDHSFAWSLGLYPKGRALPDGVRGLRLALDARREFGEGAGAILRAQKELARLGAYAGPLDGIGGPATAVALYGQDRAKALGW